MKNVFIMFALFCKLDRVDDEKRNDSGVQSLWARDAIGQNQKYAGNQYHMLFENRAGADCSLAKGKVTVSTATGEYIATWKIFRQNGKVEADIVDVADITDHMNTRGGESYSACVSRVFSSARAACDAAPKCKALCEAVDALREEQVVREVWRQQPR